MIDLTIVGTAVISGGLALAGVGLQARTSRRQMALEKHMQEHNESEQRRLERRKVYEAAIDLLSDYSWDSADPDAQADVVDRFTKPFVQMVNRMRIYGSPESVAAVDEIQRGFALLNDAADDRAIANAWIIINTGIDRLYEAARTDVGPRPQDELKNVDFQPGAGPRT